MSSTRSVLLIAAAVKNASWYAAMARSKCSALAAQYAPSSPSQARSCSATRAWVLDQNQKNLATTRAYRESRSAFPQRAALNQLGGRFLTDFYVMVARWVAWASDMVDGWPEDLNDAPFDMAAAEEGVRLAESISAVAPTPAGRKPET
jgi:hypothetical protein